MQTAQWTSAKGYSKPNERVLIARDLGEQVMIISAPDDVAEAAASSEGFSYWVSRGELSAWQS